MVANVGYYRIDYSWIQAWGEFIEVVYSPSKKFAESPIIHRAVLQSSKQVPL